MTDFFEQPEELPEGAGVKDIVTLYVSRWQETKREYNILEDQMKELKERITELEMKKIPDALLEAGLQELVTTEGLKVSLQQYTGAIPPESKTMAFDWMDQHGHSSLIKRTVSVKFDKGSSQAAALAEEAIRALGLEPKTLLDVHFQTFKAFVKEQTNKGVQLPLDQWGVFYGTKAVIK